MPLIINGQLIDDSVLETEFQQIKSYHERMNNVSCCERDPEFRETARDNIVGRVLLAQEAMRTIEPSPATEVDAALERLKQEHGGEAHFYARLGIAPDQIDFVRQDLDVSLRVQKMVDRMVAAEPAPGEAELRGYYQHNIAQFTRPEERRASHISRGTAPLADRTKLIDEFCRLRVQLLDGADFDTLARQHSDRGADLIDLGFFRRGDLPEEVEMVAFSMRIGEISPVFASSVGMHIVRLTEIRPAAAPGFDAIREEVLRAFLDERKRLRAQELVERLKTAAVVEETTTEVGSDDGTVQFG